MSRIKKLALALVVLVAVAGFLGFLPPSEPSYGPPKTGPHSVWTPSPTTTALTTTAPTTTAPTTTTAKNRTDKWVNQTHVEIQTGVLRNESWEEIVGAEVPAKAVDIWISTYARGNPTFAVATDCTGYRDSRELGPRGTSWDIVTNRSHNLSEWEFVQVARVDTGEVIARHDLNDDGPNCSPPLPNPEAAE